MPIALVTDSDTTPHHPTANDQTVMVPLALLLDQAEKATALLVEARERAAAAEAKLAAYEAADLARRTKQAERKQRSRDKQARSRDITSGHVTERDTLAPSPSPSPSPSAPTSSLSPYPFPTPETTSVASLDATGRRKRGVDAVVGPEIEALWRLYPSRGRATNSKADAVRQITARLAEGVSYDVLERGTTGYATWAVEAGIAGTERVMQAARFYGRGRNYEQYATAPEPGTVTPGTPDAATLAAMFERELARGPVVDGADPSNPQRIP